MAICSSFIRRASRDRLAESLFFRRLSQYCGSLADSGMVWGRFFGGIRAFKDQNKQIINKCYVHEGVLYNIQRNFSISPFNKDVSVLSWRFSCSK